MEGEYEDYFITMARIDSYTKAAGISLLIHITLLYLTGLVIVHVTSTSPAPDPSPIEIEMEVEPSRLIDMGSGKLSFTPGSAPPRPKRIADPVIKIAAAAPAPFNPEPSRPSDPVITDQLSPPLPEETNETSMTLPLPGETNGVLVGLAPPGDNQNAGGGSIFDLGGPSGSGGEKGAGVTGGGASSSAGDGDGDGGDYHAGEHPDYPNSARKAGREGVVTIRVLVGTDGNPLSVTVQVTSGHEDFDSAAAQAVKKWHFSPARRGGEPMVSYHDVRVRFRLNEAR